MAEIITDYGPLLWNIGKEYTYDCQLGKSVIDLTLKCNLGAGIHYWKVSRSLNCSVSSFHICGHSPLEKALTYT